MLHTSSYHVEFRFGGIVTYMDITINIVLGVTVNIREIMKYLP